MATKFKKRGALTPKQRAAKLLNQETARLTEKNARGTSATKWPKRKRKVPVRSHVNTIDTTTLEKGHSQEELDTMSMDDIEQVISDMCDKVGVVMPLEFLVNIQAGKDPRRTSSIYKQLGLIRNEFGDDPPPAGSWLWMEMCDMIEQDYQQAPVELSQSAAAAKQVAEYVYSKKRNIQIKADITQDTVASNLTAREVKLFEAKFNSKY